MIHDRKTGLWYLASPYSKYPAGPKAAYEVALRNTNLLLRNGFLVFSPIVHSHPLENSQPATDKRIWLEIDLAILPMCIGLIFLRAASWEISAGMKEEENIMWALGKPVIKMEPECLPTELIGLGRRRF
jgi:hypothetical protein